MKTKFTFPTTSLFRAYKAASPEEKLAAGGASAFGRKSGKNNLQLIKKLKKAPKAESFTNKEWKQTLKQLSENKYDEAEIKSIAIHNNWGVNRRNKLDDFLGQVNIVEIN